MFQSSKRKYPCYYKKNHEIVEAVPKISPTLFMTQRIELGKYGEKLAKELLIKKKYKIIECNRFIRPFGEIDIIAYAPDMTLVFVEVKTVKSSHIDYIKPEDQMTSSKIAKLKKTACLYAGDHKKFISEQRGWRIDLVAVTILHEPPKNFSVEHYENIV